MAQFIFSFYDLSIYQLIIAVHLYQNTKESLYVKITGLFQEANKLHLFWMILGTA